MSGFVARTRLPISLIPLTTCRALSTTPAGDIRMWEVATTLTILAIIRVPSGGVGLGADHFRHLRITDEHEMHLQNRVHVDRRERRRVGNRESLTLRRGQTVSVVD